MKTIFILFLASFISAVFIHWVSSPKLIYSYDASQKTIANKKQRAFGCAPDLTLIDFDDSLNFIPLLDGWGKYRMPVTVTNDSAGIYFQQGINMYYGFHIIEALASFEKAIKFDDDFAMGYWGKALAYGPNINDVGYSASPQALAAIKKAKELCSNCSPVEKALIDAMQVRYSSDTTQTREFLNKLYADAMKKVHTGFPNSADAAALYADALMVQHPWDLYDRFYNPKPWTPEIVRVLEKLVKKFPYNPGASHYYIHAIEGSKQPQKGLAVASRLGGMMPGLAHLVHMPSHIYIRSGYYKKGIDVNEAAVKDYYNYLSKYPVTANSSFLYLTHNLHMRAACAGMGGEYAEALKFSNETKNSVDSASLDMGGYFGMYLQYLHMTPLFTQIRFGKWDELLEAPPIPPARVYANSMWHYGRGVAFARKHQFNKANIELQKMRDSVNSPQLQEHPSAFNPGTAAVQVAEKILQGVIAEEKNQVSHAVTFLKEAADKEDGMLYNEPKDWLLPARQYLGHALLKAKQYAEAEKVYKKDLEINPNNAWSLTGLAEALAKQGKKKMAMEVKHKAASALEGSDVQINGSVF